ncbi:MAG: hypothetical protein NT154_29320 [Verrucomicrobia bacterium]|nr:hypothetical protein [Verrucomicrobiota bacterium]
MNRNQPNLAKEIIGNLLRTVWRLRAARSQARVLGLMLLAGGVISPGWAQVINFENLSAGAPGGAGGPSIILSNQYINCGVSFQNAQGFDYSWGAYAPSFAHSGSKAIEPWAMAWSDWAGLGGTALQAGIAASVNPADTWEVFVLGGDGSLYGAWRPSDPSLSYLFWEWLQAPAGLQFQSAPVTSRNIDGRREVFALGNDGQLYHKSETTVGGGWGAWYSLGGWQLAGPLGVATNADGRLEVYVRGGDNALYLTSQITPNGAWSGLTALGATPVKAFSVQPNVDGRIEMLAVGQDGVMYDLFQLIPNQGWSAWTSLGGWGLRGAVALGRDADGRLEGFAPGGDGVVYRNAQTSAGTGSWVGWSSMAHAALSTVTNLAVSSLKDGRLFLLLRQADGTLFYRAQVAPNGGWGDPVALGGADLQWPVTLARDPDGRLELWAVGNDGQVHHRRMSTLYPNGSGFVQPITLQFARPLRQLRLWAGYSASPGSDTRVVVRGFDAAGVAITNTVATVTSAISTPLTITAPSGNLAKATVAYLATESGLAANDGLAVDDVEGMAVDAPPLLSILGVWNGLAYLRYNGPLNQFVALEVSDDLRQWSQITTFTAPTSPYDLADQPPVGKTQRFYRLNLGVAHFAPGQKILVLQGLWHNTLVAGKTTALRLFTDPVLPAAVARAEATFVGPDGRLGSRTWTAPNFVTIPQSSLGPSVAVTIPGNLLPTVGDYYFSARLYNASGNMLAWFESDRTALLPTKDLRIMVDRLWSNTGTLDKPGEIEAAHLAMQRFATLWPVRDGISALDGNRSAGLRYLVNDNPIGPPNQDGQICPLMESWSNRPLNVDSIDAGITYRFPDQGEGCGGFGRRTCPGQSLVWSGIVWQSPLAYVFSHETGHIFGLEPAAEPHSDGTHTSDETIDLQEADLGFDLQHVQALPQPTYNLMYGVSLCPGRDPSQISFSPYDWEYLRQQLVNRLTNSTGPSAASLHWQNLSGWLLQRSPAVAPNADGRHEVFAVGGDGVLYDQWETSVGGDWSGWTSLGGTGMRAPVVAGADADGRLEVLTLGGDQQIWFRHQNYPNCCWADWSPLSVGGPPLTAYTLNSNLDGRLEIVAVGLDGVLYDIYQAAPNQGWSPWLSLGGTGLRGAVALGRNADGRLEAFVPGGNGVVYRNAQSSTGIGSWTGFASMAHAALSTITNVAVCSLSDGRLFLLLRQVDGALFYRAQVVPNGGWGEPVSLGGTDLLWPVSLGRGADGRLELWAVGTDGQLHTRCQVALNRPDAWSNWTAMGGTSLQAGVTLSSNAAGDLEVFVLGSDGALWRGWR